MTADIVPELQVQDTEAARAMLRDVFGFSAVDGLMVLGTQRIAVVQAEGAPDHGGIDHLALAVDDVDAAMAAYVARGTGLESTTPEGPREIAEFWDNGVRYVFLRGPEGARIELCARLGSGLGSGPGGVARAGLPSHDHIGIPCTDITATEAFFLSLGLTRVSAVDLHRPEGVIPVRFLAAGASIVELYGPPGHDGAALPKRGFWRGLRLTGTGQEGLREGPDGLRVTLC